MIKIELKDGAIIEVEKGSSIIDVAKKISEDAYCLGLLYSYLFSGKKWY